MKSFDIEDIKSYMNELLSGTKYDSFYLYEARVKTGLDYYINGKYNAEFYEGGDPDIEDIPPKDQEYVCWGQVKHTIRELMKGKRLPISFKIILMFNRDNISRLIQMNNLDITASDVSALFYNIYFEAGKLYVTTGCSLKIFTLDKSLEHVWDDTVSKYYS